MIEMIRLLALLLVIGIGLWGQGLRFRVECEVEEDAEKKRVTADDCSGEVLVSQGMSLFRWKNEGILIRPTERGMEKVEMDFAQKRVWRSALSSEDSLWAAFRENSEELDGVQIQVQANRLREPRRVGETRWQGFSFEWKALNVPMPRHRKEALLPPRTSEVGIQVDTWINPAIQIPGLGWERVAWGMPEFLVDELLGLLPSRQEVKDAVGGAWGLAMETRIRLSLMGDVVNYTIRVVDVKEGPIEAKEFAIPEGFREEN